MTTCGSFNFLFSLFFALNRVAFNCCFPTAWRDACQTAGPADNRVAFVNSTDHWQWKQDKKTTQIIKISYRGLAISDHSLTNAAGRAREDRRFIKVLNHEIISEEWNKLTNKSSFRHWRVLWEEVRGWLVTWKCGDTFWRFIRSTKHRYPTYSIRLRWSVGAKWMRGRIMRRQDI